MADPFAGEDDNLFAVFDGKTGNSAPQAPKRRLSEHVTDGDASGTTASTTQARDTKRSKKEGDKAVDEASVSTSTKETKGKEKVPIDTPVIKDEEVLHSGHVREVTDNSQLELIPREAKLMHEVVYPPGFDKNDPARQPPPAPEKPARVYKFTLDPFQQHSVDALEKRHSVLVAAHTSAGKTVVAEYAIAMALRDNQRVIYTSPLKALSNQKYREFYEEFEDVGLMTGDVTINPSASCLVMTTEILRSMLYRGSEVMREVAWVVFDEIHYMRDKERGVVWEETLVLLPEKVKYVFLSATIPNAPEFAAWIAKIKDQPCHVVYTDMRPTPLQHYLFPAGGEGLHLVVDEKSNFREENFQKALAVLSGDPEGTGGKKKTGGGGGKKRGGGSNPQDCYKIVRMIMERNYDPCIVFGFSKKECETMALAMSKLDFNDNEEKKLVGEIFRNAMDTLSEDDRKLPQIEHILPLLKRGVGIHHSGLLPILKEVIEILFQEGLLKALFATETFSIGLNMPAKTVVFTSVRKFDGNAFRWVSSGEYIQMSGRAGRRGLDDRGIVILMVDEKMEPSVIKNMVKGAADEMTSAFHLSYNMLLNLMRVDGANPEYLITQSFMQYQNERALPMLERKRKALEAERDDMEIEGEKDIAAYHAIRAQLADIATRVRTTVNEPQHVLPYLQPGRLVRVTDGAVEWGWGVVVDFKKKVAAPSQRKQAIDNEAKYIVQVLLLCDTSEKNRSVPVPPSNGDSGAMQVVPVALPLLNGVSSVRVYIPKDLRPKENRATVAKSVREVQRRFKDGVPLLDPIEDLEIKDPAFQKLVRKIESLESQLVKSPMHNSDALKEHYPKFLEKVALTEQIKSIRTQMKETTCVVVMDKLKQMKRVLRRLGYTNADNVIEMKGRVACEINTADELLITELMFTGVFNDLDPAEVAALLSTVVYKEKGDEKCKPMEKLEKHLRQLREAARRIAKVSQESKIDIDADEYANSFKADMMDVVYRWCHGAKFAEVCKMTDIFEGSIIRCMRRLEELLRQLAAAAVAIGNGELEEKFKAGIDKIKRDIVFAASLYL